jgi:hypothetical protein
METLTLVQGVTLAIAVLGAALGVINTWHGLNQTRVKLKVVPAHAIPVGAANPNLRFSIEITNVGAVPVTVCDVGVLYRGTNQRGSIVQPIILDGGQWPRRLEPRSSVTIYGQRPTSGQSQRIRCAYAKTQCGVTKTGTSGALKQIVREAHHVA